MRFGFFSSTIAYAAYVIAGCAHPTVHETVARVIEKPARAATEAKTPEARPQRNGRAFPKGVLALTWDDGPDSRTLALAELLKREHVSATFFVVSEWDASLSSDPGFGEHVYETGDAKIPILADLVALGHRVGNHTAHHALLGKLPEARVQSELEDGQRAIDPAVRDELRLFRVPGGDWSASASRAVDADPNLRDLVGPIRWDVDAKDWEGSVWCESNRPAIECEHEDGRTRVRADVMARWYESAIESAGRGIVLMHDRVGDVGSDYAYEMAERLIPRLAARGFVFAAPVLEFGAPRTRLRVGQCAGVRLGDFDGDGRADACVDHGGRVVCAPSTSWSDGGLERAAFDAHDARDVALPAAWRSFDLADVSGDGRADLCATTPSGIACALARAEGGFDAFTPWSDLDAEVVRFADVDGDGRADVCAMTPRGVSQERGSVACARSTGTAFAPVHAWVATRSPASAMAVGDVNGDGRADVCVTTKDGIDCAVSTRGALSHFTRWSSESFVSLAFADLNGDGRADACGATRDGAISCAFSNGRRFTSSSTWLAGGAGARWTLSSFGDVNGDGRSDFCDCDDEGVRCGLAP